MADNKNNDSREPGKVFSQSDLGFEYGAHEDSESFDIRSIAPALLDDLSEFIFITDAYSQKIVYINKPLARYLKINHKFCTTCYSLFRGREIPCRTCKARQGTFEGEVLAHNSLKTASGDALQVTCRHFNANGRPYNMMICTPASASADISAALRRNPDEADAVASLIEILTTKSDSPDMQINGYLRFFCTFSSAASAASTTFRSIRSAMAPRIRAASAASPTSRASTARTSPSLRITWTPS